jgi:hypothetical protein
MHDFARGVASAALAWSRNKSATLSPNEVSKPRCRKSRRETPSQRQPGNRVWVMVING